MRIPCQLLVKKQILDITKLFETFCYCLNQIIKIDKFPNTLGTRLMLEENILVEFVELHISPKKIKKI